MILSWCEWLNEHLKWKRIWIFEKDNENDMVISASSPPQRKKAFKEIEVRNYYSTQQIRK